MRIGRNSILMCLSVAAAYALVAYGTIRIIRITEEVTEIWIANALLLGVMMHRKPREAPMLLLAGTAGSLLADVLAGASDLQSVVYTSASMAEVAFAFSALRLLRIGPSTVPTERDFFLGVPAAILSAPAVSAAIAAAWAVGQSKSDFPTAFVNWWTGGVVGMAALLPTIWTGSLSGIRQTVAGRGSAEFRVWVPMIVAIAVGATFHFEQPFIVMVLPLLIAACRMGVFRTTLINFVAIIATMATAVVIRFNDLQAPASDYLAQLGIGQLGFYCAISVLGPLLVSIVVAQREHAAQALTLAKHHLETISDNLPAMIGYVGKDRRYRFVNSYYELWYGMPREEIIGRTLKDLIGAAYDPSLDVNIDRVLDGDAVRFVAKSRDGREVEAVYIPHVEDGVVQGYFVLGQDFTERRADERALFEEKERAQITLNSIGDAVVVCDAEMRVTLLNPIAEAMTGWSMQQAVGKPAHEVVKLIDIASGETPLSPLKIAIRENRSVALQSDSALERRDGFRTPIEDTASPIHDRSGHVTGAVMVFHDVSEARAMALKMSHLAQHDYLTDLPNRVLFHDRLSQALGMIDQGAQGAVMFVDLDHFKHINDSLGHQAGDYLLQEIARRLVSVVRADDTVSRQGGDEFVLLLGRLGDPRDAARVARNLIAEIERPVIYEGKELRVSASVGIALFPQDSSEIETLMKQADTALYHAKNAGRGGYSYFTESMSVRADQRLKMERDLRTALSENQFFLAYQPKILLPEQRIVGAEALVRWRMPDGAVAVPDQFVPLAEESGLIASLDEWVMREACRQNARWRRSGLSSFPVSVNVSLARFDPDRLVARVRDILEESALDARYLEIEFTESQMLQHHQQTRDLMDRLKRIGIRITIDDFGTGYSNLGYMLNYPFDALKIDRAFVRGLPDDPKSSAIVQAIVSMVKALGFEAVAEGVENERQAMALQAAGCLRMQGYFYGRPMPVHEFETLLEPAHIEAGGA